MKKIVSLVIIISMMLCMFPISSMTATATTTDFVQVDLSNDTKYPDGGEYYDEKNDITYTVVKSPTTFKAISSTPDGNYILAKDISIPGTYNYPILGSNTVLSGIINGNGYAIKHFKINYTNSYITFGVLAQGIKNNAKIINLQIGLPDNPIVYSIDNSGSGSDNHIGTGVIAGKILSDSAEGGTVEISGVDIYCKISVNKKMELPLSLGGFIGRSDGSNVCNLKVSHCSFTGTISMTDNAQATGYDTKVGSVIGYYKNGELTVSDYTNNANIDITKRTSGTSSGYSYAGGVVGRTEAKTTFIRCFNTGNMTSDKYSGGIAGHTDKLTTFTDCSNTGAITATTYSGGIAGRSYYSGTSYSGCKNSGAVTATDKAGGIVGQTDNPVAFSSCSNSGAITATSYSGGIEGYAAGQSGFTSCTNSGAITSDNYAGGVLARAYNQASFISCVNSGRISSGVNAGGVLGGAYFNGSNDYVLELDGCVNHGEIFSYSSNEATKTTAGGIIGVVNFGAYEINECGNTGSLSANYIYDATGVPKLGACGIIGRYYVNNSNTVITDCYSTGVISSSVANDARTFTPYAICTGSVASGIKLKVTGCVWNMTFNNNTVKNGLPTTNLTVDSGNNTQKNIIAKKSTALYDAYAQKSIDNTKLRILLVSATPELTDKTDIVINVYYGENQGKKFTVPANYIFALHSVEAAGDMYYAVGDAYIFGGVITGIPENINITRVEVEFGNGFEWNIPMEG